MSNPFYNEEHDLRRADDDADYPRRKPRWAGCGERPGCGADDCPTCRPGCDQSGDDDAHVAEEQEGCQPAPVLTVKQEAQLRVELRIACGLLRESIELACWHNSLEQSQRAAHISAALLVLEKESTL